MLDRNSHQHSGELRVCVAKLARAPRHWRLCWCEIACFSLEGEDGDITKGNLVQALCWIETPSNTAVSCGSAVNCTCTMTLAAVL